ncbi:MAG: tetratricopeptide repeat protein [Parabacteroides sp.]|jgi:tetratricopeptide (TPR) repeat protein|nr:tetratricopeptide repeat protein [Parabacteroides sp.]MBP8758594.1 tetratricopeptide repeat protein [Parabacteroides sp.]MBP9479933.1 tetratricopeptide repeat protein [Parabacteroides sp.]MBP9578241.1 tetratricopeptide repeat protein [Parabacteroides sp.]MDD2415644.1 tetratricopeptide repeat protein [Parabacteroides sp.]
MKRLLLTVALCVVASASFAQKKDVNTAQSIVKGTSPDFTEARNLIKGTLENAESKDDPKTWFVAGFIENQQFDAERTKQILGQKPNEPVMYDALLSILPYFEKAYTLDQQPNEKGKVKPKFVKDIKGILGANHIYYINGGAYYFDQKDYKKAYTFFDHYLKISDHEMFKGEAVAARDSNFMTVQFYAAVAATQMQDSKLAISSLENAKKFDYRRNDVYQYLCYEYEQAKDTVNLEKTLEEGLTLFPEEQYYLLSLINNYIYSNRNDKAIEYLNTAIAKTPNNAQLFDVKGRVYETGLKDFAKAEESFKKALEIDPNYTDALGNLGRVYYNQGVNKQGEANMINDTKKYQEELKVAKDFFTKALPYFEKAHQMKPEESEFMIALRGIYYNLDMGDKLKEIEAKMSGQ